MPFRGKHLTTLLLITLTVGCGFQLRGASPVPDVLQPLWVDCHTSVPAALCKAMKAHFSAGSTDLAESREQASYQLLLGNFRQQQRTSAVSAQAEAAEYDLRQSVEVVLRTSDQTPLLPETEVSAAQSYRFDSTSVLAKRRERQEIEAQLYENLARQVSFRLSSFDQQRIDEILRASDESRTDEPSSP